MAMGVSHKPIKRMISGYTGTPILGNPHIYNEWLITKDYLSVLWINYG